MDAKWEIITISLIINSDYLDWTFRSKIAFVLPEQHIFLRFFFFYFSPKRKTNYVNNQLRLSLILLKHFVFTLQKVDSEKILNWRDVPAWRPSRSKTTMTLPKHHIFYCFLVIFMKKKSLLRLYSVIDNH